MRQPAPAERVATSRGAVSSPLRLRAQREDELEQISLAILLDRGDRPAILLSPERRLLLLDLMTTAIIAVHRASVAGASKEDGDDDARE